MYTGLLALLFVHCEIFIIYFKGKNYFPSFTVFFSPTLGKNGNSGDFTVCLKTCAGWSIIDITHSEFIHNQIRKCVVIWNSHYVKRKEGSSCHPRCVCQQSSDADVVQTQSP